MSRRVQKPRTRVQRNTRTEVLADPRTSRVRTRGAAERRALLDELEEDLDEGTHFRHA